MSSIIDDYVKSVVGVVQLFQFKTLVTDVKPNSLLLMGHLAKDAVSKSDWHRAWQSVDKYIYENKLQWESFVFLRYFNTNKVGPRTSLMGFKLTAQEPRYWSVMVQQFVQLMGAVPRSVRPVEEVVLIGSRKYNGINGGATAGPSGSIPVGPQLTGKV